VIQRWFGGTFQRNLAVRTGAVSRCWVLDVDDAEALARLQASHGHLPLTRTSRSARGTHYWWRLGSTPVPSSAGRVAAGIDVRGDGGYVLVPPSVHDTGVVYEWTNDAPLVEAPAWLVDLAVRRPDPGAPPLPPTCHGTPPASGGAYGRAAMAREIDRLSRAGEGDRNHQLNRAAFALHQLVAGGVLDAGEVERRLIEACIANGLAADAKNGGMTQVLRTLRSGARAGLQHPRTGGRR
jgi:hypothetical protein